MNDYHEHELDRNDLIAAARKLWGKETSSTSKNKWRFGKHGSKEIVLDELVWFDHETGIGGGIVELCRRAGINGHYHDPGKPRPVNSSHSGNNWEPRMIPPGTAPINMLIGDRVHIYRDITGGVTHYVRRFEGPPRKFLPLTWGVLNGVTGWHSKAPKPPLPLYRIENIHELDPELILLCEGEKAADAANFLISVEELPWLALSWYGGASRAKDADLTPLAGRRVAIWPDADPPGLRARDVLLEKLQGIAPGASVISTEGLAEHFDAADLGAGDSIKAFVEARLHEPTPRLKEPEPTQPDPAADTRPQSAKPRPGTQAELPPDISIDDFYAFLPKHSYLYVPTHGLWPQATITSRFGKNAPGRLDRNRAISQIIWTPGEPTIVRDKHLIEGGWIPKPGAIVFNQYREPPLLDGDPAQAGPWLDLLKFLYPKPMEHEHIIKVLAYKLQHPEIKINHAIVFGGGMRIGKDSVILPIRRALGPWNVREARPTEIMGNFNPFVRSVILVINETRDLGDPKLRFAFYDHMKEIIASAGDVTPVNDKNEKVVQVLNVCLVLMTTNYRTDGIHLMPGDGRHFPVWSERVEADFEPDYFPRYHAWLKNGGTAHVAAYLRSLDVSGFYPGQSPPRTELYYEIIAQSRPTECAWIDDAIDKWGTGKPSVFILASLTQRASEELKAWMGKPENLRYLPHRLEECGYTKVRNPDSPKDGRWKIAGANQNIYGNKDLSEELRLKYAKELKSS